VGFSSSNKKPVSRYGSPVFLFVVGIVEQAGYCWTCLDSFIVTETIV
jgi:hypothetical protein